MNFGQLTAIIGCCLIFPNLIDCQSIKQPILISASHCSEQVAPGNESAICLKFEVPKGIWLGAEPGMARTPPGTKISPIPTSGITFSEPIYPKAAEEWVPAKLGKTNVYKEEVNIVVPFAVDEKVPEGKYTLGLLISYTPGYNAGRLATHAKEEYTVEVIIDKRANKSTNPEPNSKELMRDLIVEPKSYDDIPGLFKFMFNPMNEDKGLTKVLHNIWLDKPGHGKSVRFMPFPFLSSSNITGSSAGMGGSFFNSTKEGTMTGMFAMTGYGNNLIGGAIGLQAISCPAAYHNYQFAAYFGGEGYRNVSLHYENFTLSNSNLGIELTTTSINEPRMRFFGVGALATEKQETAYEKTALKGVFDLYLLPAQNFRFGVGLSYNNYDVGESFIDLTIEEGVPFLQNTELVNGQIGLDGSSAFGIRLNAIYDHRDQEFSPSKGFYTKMTISRNSLTDLESDNLSSSYYGLNIDMRQYISGPTQKLVILMRGGLDLKSQSDLPFYQLSSLGGPNSVRAYDYERYLGQHSFFASAEMRYTFATIPVLGYPMSIEMGAFLDAGQVFGDGVALGDELNLDPGVTMRMINKPNVGIVLNYAYGSDGGYFTGGIGLPF